MPYKEPKTININKETSEAFEFYRKAYGITAAEFVKQLIINMEETLEKEHGEDALPP